MFGYIVINEPELRMREISLYRSYYCGLCEDLLESYGRPGQLTLSYDTAFLGFLLTCLYEPADERATQTVCLTHPFHRHPMRRNRYTQYAADMTVLLARYAGQDDWEDEHRVRGLAVSGLLRGAFKKAEARHPDKALVIRNCLTRLHEIEKQAASGAAVSGGALSPAAVHDGAISPAPASGAAVSGDSLSPAAVPDAAGACFGDLMAEIFAVHTDAWEQPLRRMGFYLGKYIYLLDAYDDLEKDEKSGSFNPLVPVRDRMTAKKEDFDAYVRALLTMLMAGCCRAFEALPVVENIDILRNILYAGVWTKFEEIYARRTQTQQAGYGRDNPIADAQTQQAGSGRDNYIADAQTQQAGSGRESHDPDAQIPAGS